MKNKLTVTALLSTLLYASNGFSVYQSNLKKSNSILVGPNNELISLEEHMKEIDINKANDIYKKSSVKAKKLENKGRTNLISKENLWKSKRNKRELAVANKTRKVSTFMNRLENQRNYKAQNTLNQNHNTIQNRNIVSGTVTPLDGETLVDVTMVYFYDGSLDEYGNFNYFSTDVNVEDGTYEISVPDGNYQVMANYNGGGYWVSYIPSGSFLVGGEESQTLNLDLYPAADYAAYIFFEDGYWTSESIDGQIFPVNVYDLTTNDLVLSLFTGMLGFNYAYLLPGDYRIEIDLSTENEENIISNEVSLVAGEAELFIYENMNPVTISGSIFDEEGRVVDSAYIYIDGFDTLYNEPVDQEGNFSVNVEQGEYFIFGHVNFMGDSPFWPATYDQGIVDVTSSSLSGLELTLFDTLNYGFVSYYSEEDPNNPDFYPSIHVDFYNLQTNEIIHTGQTGIFGYNGVSLLPGEYGFQFEGQDLDTLVVESGIWHDIYSGTEGDDEHNVSGLLYDAPTGEGILGFVYFHDEFDSTYFVETDSDGYFSVSLPEGLWSSYAQPVNMDDHFMSIWRGGVFEIFGGNDFYLEHELFPTDGFGFALVHLEDSTGFLSQRHVEIFGPDYYNAITNHYGDVCSGLSPGDYTVISEDFQPESFTLESGSYEFVYLMPYQDINYNIAGHVMTVSGNPVPNAIVLYQNFNDSHLFLTDSNGYYEAFIPPNVYSAYAQVDSTHWTELAGGVVHIDEGMEQYQDFTLYPVSDYGFLVGTIFGQGPSIVMRSVNIYDEMGDFVTELHSNLYGEVAVSLLPGNYMMAFETPLGIQEHYVTIEAGLMNIIVLMDGPEFPEPRILDVFDVPEDQGGRVYIAFEQSQFDTDGAMDSMRTEMYTIERMDGDFWVGLTSIGAYNAGVYVVEVNTLSDSTSESNGLTAFRVLAHMDEGNFVSDAAYGYSVDNIAPDMVNGLTGYYDDGMIMLSWYHSQANDISHYNVYHSTESNFIPSQENLVSSPYENEFSHELAHLSSGDHFYIVSAIDIHENQGNFSETLTITILDIDSNLGLPDVFALHQNHPNPFNPATKINYDLPKDVMVNIEIYDLMGRNIRSMVNNYQSAGYKSIRWDATNNFGEPVSAGMYIYTIHAGDFKQTMKMILLK